MKKVTTAEQVNQHLHMAKALDMPADELRRFAYALRRQQRAEASLRAMGFDYHFMLTEEAAYYGYKQGWVLKSGHLPLIAKALKAHLATTGHPGRFIGKDTVILGRVQETDLVAIVARMERAMEDMDDMGLAEAEAGHEAHNDWNALPY